MRKTKYERVRDLARSMGFVIDGRPPEWVRGNPGYDWRHAKTRYAVRVSYESNPVETFDTGNPDEDVLARRLTRWALANKNVRVKFRSGSVLVSFRHDGGDWALLFDQLEPEVYVYDPVFSGIIRWQAWVCSPQTPRSTAASVNWDNH